MATRKEKILTAATALTAATGWIAGTTNSANSGQAHLIGEGIVKALELLNEMEVDDGE